MPTYSYMYGELEAIPIRIGGGHYRHSPLLASRPWDGYVNGQSEKNKETRRNQ